MQFKDVAHIFKACLIFMKDTLHIFRKGVSRIKMTILGPDGSCNFHSSAGECRSLKNMSVKTISM